MTITTITILLATYLVIALILIFGILPYLKYKNIIGEPGRRSGLLNVTEAVVTALLWPITGIMVAIFIILLYGIALPLKYLSSQLHRLWIITLHSFKNLLLPVGSRLFDKIEQFYARHNTETVVDETRSTYRRIKMTKGK